ncbi:MAG: hypothetical protein A2Y17_11625 [Clostridiales bacterium GWF2_38_85]|nr:MAG: hypothetical protein A2Y17_11625 [Clostridiales bacterium GWF2_38_85]HBL85351.1 aminoglycoside phosphotransferase [Clostridiales bacterium]
MSETYFPVRCSQLNQNALINELLYRYEVKEPITCNLFRRGMNDVYIIETEGKRYFLRISFTDVYEYQDYVDEAYIINLLNDNDIFVATPVHCKDENCIWSINAPEGIRYAMLFNEAKNNPSGDNLKKIHNVGTNVARIHTITDNNNVVLNRASIDIFQLTENPLRLIKPHLNNRMNDHEYLVEASNRLAKYISEKLTTDKPYYGFCHGDIQQSNFYFIGENPIFFDFDCMGYGWRAHDICIYLWNNTLSNEKFIESEEWKTFLEGYNAVRILDKNELLAINAFAALRGLWVMGVHADLVERNLGCQIFSKGYFDFFIGNIKMWDNRIFNK